MKWFWVLSFVITTTSISAQDVAVLHYKGGGDWYGNPTSIPNLVKYCNTHINTRINTDVQSVETSSPDIFQFPFVHMTGHGNVFFDDADKENLRNYLISGGFLHIDDNYGLKPYITKALKAVFPKQDLVELPASHEIFQTPNLFPEGLPKIHEHDGKRPQAFALFYEGRMIVLFTFESDLGDGWEDPEVHNDPEDVREKALKMGANIIYYVFNH
ncbi:DUF4159 domain-containing protein [Formosa algae]|uniref:DUF4159 domain-containing protein n=1 Tax=Formosa algae TaxID=225843 RepID=A0A9X0YN58_9FLAO|nr:DUF4159 domain-containing protein [Formosa algae]MBP1839978.1 hypothetical protein [Formosa algae]MDQ0335577.1 hypothetical protein [Formosa algae]OEI81726.1 hypothetical protein AST99_02245 [Formosa algae]